MVAMRIFVEGGGRSKALRTECRRGFRELLEKAGIGGSMPRIIACGGRQDAYDSFCTTFSQASDVPFPVLLVDSEGPVAAPDRWAHLQARDRWVRPAGALDDHCHLMVQSMEAWLLADREALADYYGPGLRERALPGNPMVEEIPKTHLLRGLENATRETTRGRYDKGKHSFAILAKLAPAKLEPAAPHAARFLEAVRRVSAA